MTALLLLATCAALQATTSITLTWQASSDPDIAGYNVYSGTAPKTYPTVLDVGNVTNAVINNLDEGRTYYFAVTSYDELGLESLPSPEIVYAIPYGSNAVSFSPLNVQTKGQVSVSLSGPMGRTVILQSSTNMIAWTPVATNVFASTNLVMKVMDPPGANKARFFRVMLQ